MKKVYEIPLCESIQLDPESNMMQSASGGDAFGNPGLPGNDLDILDPLVF